MDYQKAIEEFKNICKDQEDQSVQIPECVMVIAENINFSLNDLIEYRKLGTLEEVQEAAENQKEERPIAVLGVFGGEEYECKNCGSPVEYLDDYCRCCGNKQDWSGFE